MASPAASLRVPTASLRLPDGTRLVHIGPPKTGTTSLQSAFHVGRRATEAQGVHYTGSHRQPVPAVLAVTRRVHPSMGEPPAMSWWKALVREVRRSNARQVVISSEFFADADSEAIRRVVADLDPSRVHIAVTLRPLARILPSQWQQYVQSGMRVSYGTWLDAMFNQPRGKISPTFWGRHRHDELVARWAEVVGPANVTVIALDDRDRPMVLRVFEQLTGLTDGTLVAEDDLTNRSLTLPETEVIRAFNIGFRKEGLPTALHTKVIRYGATAYMKTREPGPDERRVETPQWALDRAGEVARGMVAAIRACGVRIVGDLDAMAEVPVSRSSRGDETFVAVPPEAAATATLGVLLASGLAREGRRRLGLPDDEIAEDAIEPGADRWVPSPAVEPLEVFRVSTDQLIGVVLRRLLAAGQRRLHSVIRR